MLEDLSSTSVQRLQEFMKEASDYLTEIEDRKESLKDLTAVIAGELMVKPAELSKALTAYRKNNLADLEESMDNIRAICAAAQG